MCAVCGGRPPIANCFLVVGGRMIITHDHNNTSLKTGIKLQYSSANATDDGDDTK